MFVISKGKVQSMRSASRPAPVISPLRGQLAQQSSTKSDTPEIQMTHSASARGSFFQYNFLLLDMSVVPIFSMKLMLNLLAASADRPPLDLPCNLPCNLPSKVQDETDFMR